MATTKDEELARTTAIRGFRYGLHDLLAEVDLNALRKTNDKVEADYTNPPEGSLLDRRTKELVILAACMGQADEAPHLQIHMHAATREGVTKEELWELIGLISPWMGITGTMKGYEAWRGAFRPDLPPVERVVELS